VGYTPRYIPGLGDLAALRSELMSELLHRKSEEAIANALGKSIQKYHPRIKIVDGNKRRKRK
jgi:hypothetical protein